MLDIQTKFQAVAFVNATDITPSPENISYLLDKFRDKEFLPSTFQEMSSEGIKIQPRIRLTSQTGEWSINIGSARIDIEKNALTKTGDNLGAVEDFVKEAVDFFERIFSHFKKKSSRLTIATNGLLEEMTSEKLNEVFRKFSNPPAFYEDNPPFEWNQRFVSQIGPTQIGDFEEFFNVIASVSRVRGNILEVSGNSPFDRIEISFDINTIAENLEPRYSADDAAEFFKAALGMRTDLLEQFESLING